MLGPFRRSSKVSHNALGVVTGAGSGIGAAFAVELARRGSRVVCSDINEVAAAKTVSTITDNGGDAVAIACDVSRFDDVRELAAHSESWLGAAPTLVINNAGVGSGGAPIGELPLDDWRWVLRHQPVGTHPRLPRFRPDPAFGGTVEPPAGHHQRRLGRGVRRGPRHGRLQCQQGRCVVAVGDPGRRIIWQRSKSHGAMPYFCQDEHRRIRPYRGRDNASSRRN